MSIKDIKEAIAPVFVHCKFKELQTVHFFQGESVEVGIITYSHKNSAHSTQPSYSITYLNDDFKLVSIQVDEEDIFSSYEEILDYAHAIYPREKFRQVFKHFTKTQFLKQEFQEGLPLDEYIYHTVEK